ncbi:MAG: ATP-binding protein [Pseudomonadota bacterium]
MISDRDSLVGVFNKMSEGILVLDADWHILYANENGRRYLGLSATEKRISEDLRPKLASSFILSTDLADIESAEDSSLDFKASNPADRSYDMTLALYMSRPTEDGKRILLIRDVTEEQRDKEIKQDFLSFISHRLRTPASVISISLSNLADCVLGPLNEHQMEVVETSQRKMSQLVDIINRLITFTSLRDERLKAESCCIDAAKVAKEFSESFAHRSHPKPVKLRHTIETDDTQISFRETLFTTVLECILDNSVKFSKKRGVTISISCRKSEETGEMVMDISDDGPGIPPAVQQNAFQAFTQRDDDFTGNIEGLGLGLTTVNYLMNLYGGQAILESARGKGTTIRLIFPPHEVTS